MRKIIFSVILAFSILIISGCMQNETISYKGLSFKYPTDMTLSYNDFHPFDGENIDVEVTYIGEIMSECAQTDMERGIDREGLNPYRYYINLLESLRDNGLNEEVEELNSLTCNFSGHSISAEPISIEGLNGVVFVFDVGNSGSPSLTTFFKQVLLVGPENQVYSIVFNYDFGELGKYLNKIKDEFGEGILDEKEGYKWEEVYNYFVFGSPIKDKDMKMFENNDKVIRKIIDSIQIED